jgi:endonuclease YncB( thermonuclease family)
MRAMVHGRELQCELDATRTYDRCAGICYIDDENISEIVVRLGLARHCPGFSGGR